MENRLNPFYSTPIAIILGAVIISGAILVQGGYIKLGKLAGNSSLTGQVGQAPAPSTAPQPTSAKVSVDDDPSLGDKNAPITLIEFSDYECPFCKRHFDQTYPQLKKDYIDTGKVKLVYRDYPLSFHDPMATYEAQAANCAKEGGGDVAYFKIHDEIFKRTTSNGTGLALDKLSVIANDLGLNGSALQTCLDTEKYKAEVDKDLADATKVGASGTPTFFIGKSTENGIIEGTKIVGAQPFSVFQAEIDKQLK